MTHEEACRKSAIQNQRLAASGGDDHPRNDGGGMSKKHRQAARGKQRRKYEASNSAIYVIMAKTQRYTPDEQRKLQLPVYLALDAMTAGTADANDMGTLCRACNVCLIQHGCAGPCAAAGPAPGMGGHAAAWQAARPQRFPFSPGRSRCAHARLEPGHCRQRAAGG